jgi:anti-sigma B factor antagonist
MSGAGCLPVLWTSRDNGVVTVHGEVDITTCDLFESVVNAAVEDCDGSYPGVGAHLDLAGIEFIDVAGARVLVAAATAVRGGFELIVHRPPAMLVRIVELGWGKVAALRFEPCRGPTLRPESASRRSVGPASARVRVPAGSRQAADSRSLSEPPGVRMTLATNGRYQSRRSLK